MGPAPTPWQILLAEDNPADVGLVREAFREHKIHCDLFVIPDGQEVLAFIDRLDRDSGVPCPDLLLLDLGLPKFDGHAILRHLRASTRCRATPVIVMTSSDWERAKLDEAVHYFHKPTSLMQFLQLGGIVKGLIQEMDLD